MKSHKIFSFPSCSYTLKEPFCKFSFILLVLWSLLHCKQVNFNKGENPILTGWEDSPQKLHSAYCANCHSDVHSNWKNSIHAKSWSNELFQKSFQTEKLDWCVHCHAPLTYQKLEYKNGSYNSNLLEEGINCAVCHVRGGQIYGPNWNWNSSHFVVKDSNFNRSEFCAGCHQFNFPILKNGEMQFSEVPMQNVFHEWQNSQVSKQCQGCHWKKHDLKGPNDIQWMKSLFSSLEWERNSESTISIRFSILKERAHSLPEGDLFRSLVLQVAKSSHFQEIVFEKKFARKYNKAFRNSSHIWNRELQENSSISPETSIISFTIDYPYSEPPKIRLIYYLHDPDLGGTNDSDKFYYILKEN